MVPSTDLKASAPRIIAFSVLHSPAHPYRYRRFACPLAGTDARLAEERGSVTPSLQRTFTSYLPPVRLAHQIGACVANASGSSQGRFAQVGAAGCLTRVCGSGNRPRMSFIRSQVIRPWLWRRESHFFQFWMTS